MFRVTFQEYHLTEGRWYSHNVLCRAIDYLRPTDGCTTALALTTRSLLSDGTGYVELFYRVRNIIVEEA